MSLLHFKRNCLSPDVIAINLESFLPSHIS